MSSTFGMMDEGYFVPKGEIFKWILLHLNKQITSIQTLGTGTVYCELLNKHSDKDPITPIISNPTFEHEYIHNLKLFQRTLEKLKTGKKIDILKLSKCKYLDNLETIQWLKRYLETNQPKTCSLQQTSLKKINSPRLCTSPNINNKKFQVVNSPRNLGFPSQSKNKCHLNSDVGPSAISSSTKICGIQSILKNIDNSPADKLIKIKELIYVSGQMQNQVF